MSWKEEAFSVILPDPYDPEAPWISAGTFETRQEAVDFVQGVFGADAEGRIGTISNIRGEGWLVDLPNPHRPEDVWVFVESFERKRDAVRFVKEHYGGDAHGRLTVIDVMEGWEEEKGPKDWSPRKGTR